jgi:hypothetical protein
MKKALRLFLIGVIISSALSATSFIHKVFAETEPNDTPSQANDLPLGIVGDTNTTIATNSDVDWYKLSLVQDHYYVFETYNVSPNLHTVLSLYDTDSSTQLAYDYGSGTGNSYSRIVWQVPLSGIYYLKVSSSSGQGPYSIRALQKYDEGGVWDATLEPNDNWQTAYALSIGRENAITTTIYPNGPYTTNNSDQDFYRFWATEGHWYQIETFNVAPSLNTGISLYSMNGTSKVAEEVDNGTGNVNSRIVWQAPLSGIYYIRVWQYYSTEGQYSIQILPKYDEGATWSNTWESDDEWTTATPVTLGQTIARNIYARGNYSTYNADRDYFWFAAQAGNQYNIDLLSVASTLSLNLYLIGPDGARVLKSDESYTNPGTLKSLVYTFFTSGIYYVMVRPQSNSYNNYGDYQLRVSTTGQPSLFTSKSEYRFVGSAGGANPEVQYLTLANQGRNSFQWQLMTDQNWLHFNTTSGTAGAPSTVQLSVDTNGLLPGDYTANLTVTTDIPAGMAHVLPISLRVDQAVAPDSESEPNDTPSLANTLTVGRLTPISAHLFPGDGGDWYKVTLEQNHWYIFETFQVATGLNTVLTLYDTNSTTQLAYDYGSGTGNSYSRITFQAPNNGTYYLKVWKSSGWGSYNLRALPKYDVGGSWDGYQEPNDSWQTAFNLTVGRENAITSAIYPNGPYSTPNADQDYYRFEAILGHWYDIETFNVSPNSNTGITLFGTDGTSRLAEQVNNGTGNVNSRIVWQAPQNGVYYVNIWQYYADPGQYSLRILTKYDEGASWDANWEPDDEWMTATPIILNQTQNRSLYERGNFRTNASDRDYFWFWAQAGYQYTVSLVSVGSTLSANLYLLSLDHSTILVSDNRYTDPGALKSVSYTFATPGIYYVMVRPQSDSSNNQGSYALRVTSVVPAIQVNQENIVLPYEPGNTITQHQQLKISNSGSGTFDWSIASSASWLKANPQSGNSNLNTAIDVWADLTGMPEGDYNATLTITANGIENSPYEIPVTARLVQSRQLYLPLLVARH